MLGSATRKVMRVGRATVFMVGLAVMLALVLGVATTALAAIPGDPFRLGEVNSIDAMSALVGGVAGTMLTVDNNSTAPGATALELRVAPGQAPMKVNSGAKVALLNADTLDGQDSTFFAKAYKRTVVVSPTGTDTQNGQALLNALNGITDASATKKYLLYIEPGTYDLGSSSLQMKQYVDIEGAGELSTLVTSAATASGCLDTGTVIGNSNAELRFLTVQNTATGGCSLAIRNSSASPRLTYVTAKATTSGTGLRVGVFNTGSSAPTMTDVTATVSGGSSNYGVMSDNSAAPTMTDVTATASGGTTTYGVANVSTATITMTNVTATASGGTRNNSGVRVVNGSTIIRQSKLAGSTTSLSQIGGTANAALTQLVGPVSRSANVTLRCFNNYDQNMAAVSCP